MSTWLRDQNLLELLLKTASGATEQPTEPPPPWLRLQRRETVIWSGSGVHLVEARSAPQLPTLDSAYSGLELDQLLGRLPGPLPDDVRILDKGTAVITTTRALFAGGRHRREWTYGRVRGLGHVANTPVTLFRLGAPKVFGLLLPEPITVEFRFLLGLALADRAKARHLLGQRLERLLAEHGASRPVPPPQPRHRSATRAAGSVVAAVAAAVAVLAFFWIRTNGTPVAAVDPPTSSQSTSQRAAGQVTRTPSPTPSTPSTPDTPPPTPTASLCGAPSNPYGYHFCDGGALVRNPDPQVCEYFTCIWNFSSGRGYLVQCEDGMVSLWGGLNGVCGEHGGVKRPVYR